MARVLTFSNYDANADYLFEQLGWRKLGSQRQISKAVMVYKLWSIKKLSPDYLCSKFVDRSSVTNYSLKDTENKLHASLPRTNSSSMLHYPASQK